LPHRPGNDHTGGQPVQEDGVKRITVLNSMLLPWQPEYTNTPSGKTK
jgi:hypothetical protein